MTEYWSSFFLRAVEVHKHAKKERGQYPAILTEQVWLKKDLLYGDKRQFFSCRIQRVIPSVKDSVGIFTNHSAGFGSSCPRRS